MRVAAYCRVSTVNQKDEGTIDLQVDAIESFVSESEELELVEKFLDEGYSGGLSDRPGLSNLLNFLDEDGHVDAVVIYKLDRLARDLYIQEGLIIEFEKRGVKLLSLKERDLDSSDPMRIAFRQFMGIVAELEKSFITMRLSAGRIGKAQRGRYAGGGIALGYKTVEKDLTIDTERLADVSLIYRLREEGGTLRSIAAHLNQNKIPVPRNARQWWPGAVQFILANKLYSGLLEYKGHAVERPDLALPTNRPTAV